MVATLLFVQRCSAIQDAIRIVSSVDDTCSSVCLNRGKIFCGRTDFQAGYCCNSDGCSDEVLQEAPLCSNSVDSDLLKYFVCPRVTQCGPKIHKASAEDVTYIAINPFETFLTEGDKCSYMLSVDNYE